MTLLDDAQIDPTTVETPVETPVDTAPSSVDPTTAGAVDAVSTEVSEVTASPITGQPITLDGLKSLGEAASNIVNYYGGATYEHDRDLGVETLKGFGLNFSA